MVSFINAGRLGNVCFELATAIAYALDHGLDYTAPSRTKNPKWNPIYFQHLVNPKWNPKLPKIEIKEKQHNFYELPFEESWRKKNILLNGYFQTEKYFARRRDEVLKAFNLPWEPMQNWVSVHVRRGDYLVHTDKHPPVTVEWYENAMSRFPGAQFMFFSDDLPYCKEHFGHREDCCFSEDRNEMQDLTLGSWCERGHVCSASTFSYWQAWMNRNPSKQIVIPRDWFVKGWGNLDVSDIVPENWIRI